MYSILCDEELFFDSRVEELALINPVVNLQVNSAGSFTFIIPPDHPYYNKIEKRKTLLEVYRDEEEEPIFAGVCTSVEDDFFKQRKITCEGELSFLNDSMQRPRCFYMDNSRLLLDEFIKEHNLIVEESKRFTLGIVTADNLPQLEYIFTDYNSTMKTIKSILVDQVGGYLRIRHKDGKRYLDYLKEAPNTSTQVIKLGENLIDFTTTLDTTQLATVVIPLGAPVEEPRWEGYEEKLTIASVNGGKDYVKSDSAVNTFGWIEQVVEWNEVDDAGDLKTLGEKYLSDIQFENMVIKANAIDLNLDDSSIESFKILDKIRVVSAPHGLNRYFVLTSQTINLNNPEKDTVTLGMSGKTSMTVQSKATNDVLLKDLEKIKPSVILESAKDNATQLITNSQNGFVTMKTDENGHPTELLVMDTNSIDTATKVWRWNVNGLGYSSTGYNGTYGTAMTMDGAIVADKITTGTMSADRIRGGELLVGGSGYAKNGSITVQTSSNSQIAKIDRDGVTINQGELLLIDDSSNYVKLNKYDGLTTRGDFYRKGSRNQWNMVDGGGLYGGLNSTPSRSNANYTIGFDCTSTAKNTSFVIYSDKEFEVVADDYIRLEGDDDIAIIASGSIGMTAFNGTFGVSCDDFKINGYYGGTMTFYIDGNTLDFTNGILT